MVIKNSIPMPQCIHILSKPIGPKCNLSCEYCFYLEKQALFPIGQDCRMSDDVLFSYITKYIKSQPTKDVEFVWQGGEPTLLGLDFFEKVVEFQKPFVNLKNIKNTLQTNGLLINDKWCEFLRINDFLVGISLDGPRDIHNRYRRGNKNAPSFDRVMNGLKLLQKHAVDYNVLSSVAKETAYKPLEVYHFFKEQGVQFIQFAPIVEREASAKQKECGFQLAGPASLVKVDENDCVTEWTVESGKYGEFLIAIFDEWVRNDVGKTFVMNFEWALNAWIGNPSPVCYFARQCGRSVVLEHNGDIYACDHSVFPEYKLGNILVDDPLLMAERSMAAGFGVCKDNALPKCCQRCDVLEACWGGCPNQRFTRSHHGEPGLHYLCNDYRNFFQYTRKYLNIIKKLIENGYPASNVMKAIDGPLVFKRR